MGLSTPIPGDAVDAAALFFVGMDADGRWIARDNRGLLGGIFQDRAAAIKFALFESGRKQAVLLVPDHVRLSLAGRLPDFV